MQRERPTNEKQPKGDADERAPYAVEPSSLAYRLHARRREIGALHVLSGCHAHDFLVRSGATQVSDDHVRDLGCPRVDVCGPRAFPRNCFESVTTTCVEIIRVQSLYRSEFVSRKLHQDVEGCACRFCRMCISKIEQTCRTNTARKKIGNRAGWNIPPYTTNSIRSTHRGTPSPRASHDSAPPMSHATIVVSATFPLRRAENNQLTGNIGRRPAVVGFHGGTRRHGRGEVLAPLQVLVGLHEHAPHLGQLAGLAEEVRPVDAHFTATSAGEPSQASHHIASQCNANIAPND